MSIDDAQTILQLFACRVEESGGNTAIRYKHAGAYQGKTWNELAADVYRVGAGLAAAGIEPGDRVAQLSENRYEWVVADLAIQAAQAVHVPIHAPLAAAQVDFQINHSGAKVVLVSTAEQLRKVNAVAQSLPADLLVVTYDRPDVAVAGPHVPLADWLGLDESSGKELAKVAVASQSRDELATILYTSGTTGEPKGVMLTQDNLVSNTLAAIEAFAMRSQDVRLGFLPLSHIFARTADLYTWIGSGSEYALAESRDTVIQDCGEIQPTILNGVPYFYDRVVRALQQLGLADKPGSLRQLLGGRMEHCCSGGAALPDHIFDFFLQQGVPILQGYGLTETSPVISMSSPGAYRRGASGRAIRDVEIKIADDGELLTRGPHVMAGYWRNDAATAETVRDGWLYTGDLGRVDEDGFVWITGRKKELIVTAAGKNVAPVLLESLLTEDPLIEQAMVIGDGRNYLSALIVANREELGQRLSASEAEANDWQISLDHPAVQELFAQCIEQRLECVSYHEQLRRFTLLDRPFSIEQGEMTPKLSLRRPIISAHFAEQIEAMYSRTRTDATD